MPHRCLRKNVSVNLDINFSKAEFLFFLNKNQIEIFKKGKYCPQAAAEPLCTRSLETTALESGPSIPAAKANPSDALRGKGAERKRGW